MFADKLNAPLFPLNVVLFPGMVLPLHIFEPRYRLMIQECLAANQTFGVVLARNKKAQAGDMNDIYPDDLYEVGTMAQITAVERLDDGRLNLITVGQDRFVIHDIQASADDYLIGAIEPFIMNETEDSAQIALIVPQLRKLVKQYIEHLGQASGEDLSQAALPDEPLGLAFLAGTAIQGPLMDKQKLLAARSLRRLVLEAIRLVDREDQLLLYMLKAHQSHQQAQTLPFVDYSLN